MILKLEKARVDNWTKRKFFEGTSAKIGPSIDQTGLPVTGLKDGKEEAKWEGLLGLPKGTLGRNSSYWNDFVIIVDANGSQFNTDVNEDALKIKFLQAQTLVAQGSDDLLKNSKAEYLLFSEEAEKVSKNKVRRRRNEALKKVAGMDPAELKGMIYMYGHNPTSMSEDAIEDFIYEKVEQDPATFQLIAKDPTREAKVFVHALTKSQILEVRGGAYMYNGEVVAYGLDATAQHLQNKKHQELRIALEKQLIEK